MQLDRPMPLEIELTAFSIPPLNEDGGLTLSTVAVQGTVRIDSTEPISIATVDAEKTIGQLNSFNATFESAKLDDGVKVRGEATGDFGTMRFGERFMNLLDDQGSLQLTKAMPEGVTNFDDVPGSVLTRFIGDESGIADLLFDEPCQAVIHSTIDGDSVRFLIGFSTPGLTGDAAIVQGPVGLTLDQANVKVQLTPELLALAQGETESPLVSQQTTLVTIELAEHRFPGSEWTNYQFLQTPENDARRGDG